MGVAFDQTGAGDADELCFFMQLGDRGAAGVAHTALYAAHELEDVIGKGAPIRRFLLYGMVSSRLPAGQDRLCMKSLPQKYSPRIISPKLPIIGLNAEKRSDGSWQ